MGETFTGEERLSMSKCLICNCMQEPDCEFAKISADSVSNSIISTRLQTIFLLKKVFEIPSNQLSGYLKNCPKIESWIGICVKCRFLVERCKTVYEQLLKVRDEYWAAKLAIIEAVRTTVSGNEEEQTNYSNNVGDDWYELGISDDCRSFISSNEYSISFVDPFIDGDIQAEIKLLEGLVIKEEPQEQVNSKGEGLYDEDNAMVDADWKLEPDELQHSDSEPDDLHSDYEQDDLQSDSEEPDDLDSDYEQDDLQSDSEEPDDLHSDSEEPDDLHSDSEQDDQSKTIQHSDPEPEVSPKPRKRSTKPGKESKPQLFKAWNTCDICGIEFSTRKLRNEHKGEVHGKKKFPCEVEGCGKSYQGWHALKTHWLYRHQITPQFKCSICGKEFFASKALKQHAKLHINPVQCDLKKKKNRVCRNQHNKNVHENKKFPCEAEGCGKVFASKQSLKEHMPRHGDSPQYICRCCGKAYFALSQLKYHEMLHINAESLPYECDLCPQRFPRLDYLKNHKKSSAHNPNSIRKMPEYPCEMCSEVFTNKRFLKRHVSHEHINKGKPRRGRQVAVATRPMKCHICFQEFAVQNALKIHVKKKHKMDVRFFCAFCGETKNDKLDLIAHQRDCKRGIQTNDNRQHKCSLCSGRFKTPRSLRLHVKRVHEKEYPIYCDICGNGMHSKTHLENHREACQRRAAKRSRDENKGSTEKDSNVVDSEAH